MLNATQLIGFMSGAAALEPHLYWRLRASQEVAPDTYGDRYLELYEIEFRSVATGVASSTGDDVSPYIPTPSGSPTCTEADITAWNLPAFSSPINYKCAGAYQARGCFDNYTISSTWWPDQTYNPTLLGAYIGIEFDEPKKVREVIINSYAASGFTGMAVEYSDDKLNWYIARDFRDMAPWASGWKVFTLFP